MKTDSSLLLYNKYYSLTNKEIEVELKNKTKWRGKFLGYFRGEKKYISKWQLVDIGVLFGSDNFGFLMGRIIVHKDIVKIFFFQDNSIMML